MKEELLFQSAYQDFYKMASESDVNQINTILNMVDLDENACVLDVGCGNGKMLEYIHNKVGAEIYGFDYSENAIRSAVQRMGNSENFRVAFLGDLVF